MILLKNKTAIITGSSQGLGLEIAKSFITNGASIVICARNAELLNKAYTELSLMTKEGQKIYAKVTDVSIENEVNDLLDFSLSKLNTIDILVNNAAIHGPKGELESMDMQEWIYALQVNLFGSIFSCKRILPHMKKNKHGKIINLSGGGATAPFPRMSAYATSKAALVRFTETLAVECKNDGIQINAIAPGIMNTRLLDDVISAGPQKVGQEYYKKILKHKKMEESGIHQAANLCVFLASDKSDKITGKLISAVWDPWQHLEDHISDLEETDIYTLRRIVPEDRKKHFGPPVGAGG